MTRTVAPELARIALMTAPPFPMRLPTCARGINNRQIGAAAFARPPLALKSRPFSPLSEELAPECVVSVVVVVAPSSVRARARHFHATSSPDARRCYI